MNRSTLRGGNARINLLAWLIPLSFLFGGATAQTSYTKQTARVLRWQCDTQYNSAGTATAVNVDVFMVQRLVNSGDSTDVVSPNPVHVRFDLLDATLASTSITAAGKTVTYPQLAALLRQAALDRANAAGIQ